MIFPHGVRFHWRYTGEVVGVSASCPVQIIRTLGEVVGVSAVLEQPWRLGHLERGLVYWLEGVAPKLVVALHGPRLWYSEYGLLGHSPLHGVPGLGC